MYLFGNDPNMCIGVMLFALLKLRGGVFCGTFHWGAVEGARHTLEPDLCSWLMKSMPYPPLVLRSRIWAQKPFKLRFWGLQCPWVVTYQGHSMKSRVKSADKVSDFDNIWRAGSTHRSVITHDILVARDLWGQKRDLLRSQNLDDIVIVKIIHIWV